MSRPPPARFARPNSPTAALPNPVTPAALPPPQGPFLTLRRAHNGFIVQPPAGEWPLATKPMAHVAATPEQLAALVLDWARAATPAPPAGA